jgi:F-type H+-transporting ATPase subunit b
MDALSNLGIDGKLLLSQIVNFLILLFVLQKLLYKPIVSMLDNRKKTIAEGLENAQKAEVSLSEADEKAKEVTSKALARSDEIIEQAKKDASTEAQAIIDAANKKAEKIAIAAKANAEAQEEKIVQKAKSQLSGLITIAVEKIIGQKTSTDDVERAIKEIS